MSSQKEIPSSIKSKFYSLRNTNDSDDSSKHSSSSNESSDIENDKRKDFNEYALYEKIYKSL